jgi:lipoate-protein ligase A
VANITEFLKEPMSIIQFREKIIQSIFRDAKKIPIYRLSEEHWEEVKKLANEKYRTWDWNFGRSPEFNIQKTNRFAFGQIDARMQVKDGVIEEIKFFGDFLGHGDTEEIEKNLTGKKYKEEEILPVLKSYNLNLYFGTITPEEFTAFLIG